MFLMGASLIDLVIKYFRQRGYGITRDVVFEGSSGIQRKFDLCIRKDKEQHLVKVMEWKRTVGVNMVLNMDKASHDVKFSNPILISGKFSGHAKAYANRRGVTLLTKSQILRRLRWP